MKIAYKLTDSKMRTYKGFQWEIGKWYETTGKGKFCSSNWLHFYSDPLVGLFMNPNHANIENPRLFRAEVEGKFLDDHGLKCGYTKARLVEELPVPQISPVQRVRFAIFCVKEVYKGKKWNEWANNWLSGKDRTMMKAWNRDCTKDAIIATNAALAAYAFYANNVPGATLQQWIAEIAIYAAKSVTESVAESIASATESKEIDLIGIARKAMEN